MPRFLSCTFAGIILGLLAGVPVTYGIWRNRQFRNFHVVQDGVLYRSGQLTAAGLKRVVHDHGIKTVVTLRYAPSADRPAPDQQEENMCRAAGLHYYRLKHQGWTGGPENDSGYGVPAEVNIRQFLDIMKDPRNHPVLVHCFAGIHRTGAMCALYRMEFEHWSPAQAMQEMRELGYTATHPDVFRYLENYQPRGIYQVPGKMPLGVPAGHLHPVHDADPGNQQKPLDESNKDDPRAKKNKPSPRTVSCLARPGDHVQITLSPTLRELAPNLEGGTRRILPDGTVYLDILGRVQVAGLSHERIARLIMNHLGAPSLTSSAVAVDVFPSAETDPSFALVLSGKTECVLPKKWHAGITVRTAAMAAASQAEGSVPRRVWIVRPAVAAGEMSLILPVDWQALDADDPFAANYPLFPGDQVHMHLAARVPAGTEKFAWLKNPLRAFVVWTSNWFIPVETSVPQVSEEALWAPAVATPLPDQDTIRRALNPAWSMPLLREETRSNFDFTMEQTTGFDPTSFSVPLAQALPWKCTVHYTEHVTHFLPWPMRAQHRREQVIYLDRDTALPAE